MAEIRKALTDTQAKYLGETQATLTKTRAALHDAERHAQQVLSLIFDAVGVASEDIVRYDEETKELVVVEHEAPVAEQLVLVEGVC